MGKLKIPHKKKAMDENTISKPGKIKKNNCY